MKTKRKLFEQTKVLSDILHVSNNKPIISKAKLIAVNYNGLYFEINKQKISKSIKAPLQNFLNHPVKLNLSGYECHLDGIVKNIYQVSKDLFKVHVGYTKNTPAFYKECVQQLIA